MRDKWLIWCEFNYEQNMLAKRFGDLCVSIQGSTPDDMKVKLLDKWLYEDVPILITKVKCFGFGMNFQKCHNMIFCGISDSYEKFYQAVRRCYRFGQENDVNVYVVLSQREMSVLHNIKKKQAQHDTLSKEMVNRTCEILKNEIHNTMKITEDYAANQIVQIPKWVVSEDIV